MWTRGPDFDVVEDRAAFGGHVVDVRTPNGVLEDLYLPLYGRHQADNAAIAVAAVEAFFDRQLEIDLAQAALAGVTVPGRFEIMGRAPLVLIDGAHNPDGARAAAATLAEEFDVPGRRVLVVGMLAGRDPVQMLEALDVRRADLLIACTPDSPRAMAAADVAAVSRALGVMTEEIDDVPTAVQRALAVSTDDDVILIAGSLYVAGAARTLLEAHFSD